MKKKIAGLILFLIFISGLASGLKNPVHAYCQELGYDYLTRETSLGSQSFCKFSDDTECPGWDFLLGKCGQEYSYCKREGYGIKTIIGREECGSPEAEEECAVCILNDGQEVEVSKLMGLNLIEGRCGDNTCALGENYGNCPGDCSSGSIDVYCDGMVDGICDPDCTAEEDADCPQETTTTSSATTTSTTTRTTTPSILTTTTAPQPAWEEDSSYLPQAILFLLVLIGAIFLIYRIRKERQGFKRRGKEDDIKVWIKKKLKDGEDPQVLKRGLEAEGYDPGWVDEADKKIW